MDYSGLVCISAFGHCAYRQECLLVCAPSRGSLIIDKVPAFFIVFSESGIYRSICFTINMNDTIEIKYIGEYEPLKKYILKISPELVRDGKVYPSAQTAIWDAMSEIPEFDSFELPENLWVTEPRGDRVFLSHWEVEFKQI